MVFHRFSGRCDRCSVRALLGLLWRSRRHCRDRIGLCFRCRLCFKRGRALFMLWSIRIGRLGFGALALLGFGLRLLGLRRLFFRRLMPGVDLGRLVLRRPALGSLFAWLSVSQDALWAALQPIPGLPAGWSPPASHRHRPASQPRAHAACVPWQLAPERPAPLRVPEKALVPFWLPGLAGSNCPRLPVHWPPRWTAHRHSWRTPCQNLSYSAAARTPAGILARRTSAARADFCGITNRCLRKSGRKIFRLRGFALLPELPRTN